MRGIMKVLGKAVQLWVRHRERLQESYKGLGEGTRRGKDKLRWRKEEFWFIGGNKARGIIRSKESARLEPFGGEVTAGEALGPYRG